MEQEDMNVYSTNELGLETEYALPVVLDDKNKLTV